MKKMFTMLMMAMIGYSYEEDVYNADDGDDGNDDLHLLRG